MPVDISIIMPSLNVAKYINQCLESVVSQTKKEIEIICIDAGSTDGTLQIIEDFAKRDNRIRIINSPIKSYGYQMNLGIDASCGEYIGIVETDDFIELDMFDKMYEQIKDNNVDFVKGAYIGFIGNEDTIERKFSESICKDMLGHVLDLKNNRKLGILSPVHIWSGIYRKQFLIDNDIRFNETHGASFQDTSFSILVGMVADSCIYIDDAFYHYRMDNANSSVKSASKIRCVVDEYEYLIQKLKELNKYSDDVREIIERQKLLTYEWNYERLNADGRHEFIDIIKNEMNSYTDSMMSWEMTQNEKQIVEKLTDYSLIKKNLSVEQEFNNKLKKFIGECKNGIGFNVVGAGKLFDKLINIKKAIKCDFIKSLSDNSTDLHGKYIHGYLVKPVEYIAERNKYDQWIITNRYHSKEIFDQLIQLGIPKENIIVFEKMIDIDLIWEFCL